MKTKLLLLALIVSAFGYAQMHDNIPTGSGYYLNKIIPSPPTSDLTFEYFEFRGGNSEVVPTGLYFIMVEGDGEASGGVPKTDMGKVKEAVDLKAAGIDFGSNGILALVSNYTETDNGNLLTTNPYTSVISSNANIITIELEGTDVGSSSSSAVDTKTPDIGYDGNFTDASGNYMLIYAPTNPKDHDLDSNDDGVIDDATVAPGAEHLSWILYDSVAYLDYDDPVAGDETGEYGYSQIVYARTYDTNPTDFKITPGATIVNQGTANVTFILRQGTKTGYTENDWVGAANAGSPYPYPNWEFSSTTSKVSPDEFVDYQMPNSIFGELNPTQEALSVDNAIASKFSVYPNPVKDFLTIDSRNINISSVNVFNVLGTKVLERKELTDNKLDVSTLSNGIYFLKISADNASVTKKFIVE